MFSFLLRIQDRDKHGKGIGLHLGGGDTAQNKCILRGGTPHILSRYFNKGGDTAQIQSGVYSARKSIWSVGGWVVLSGNITTSWLHLASWNLPDSQFS